MAAVHAGNLRHRILIQEKVTTLDTQGNQVVAWADVSSRWAHVEPLSAKELIAAQAQQSEVVARITIRYMTGLDHSMRIVFRGQVYNIAGVIPDRDSGLEHITLPVSYGVNDG